MPPGSRKSDTPALNEAATWRAVGASWRQIFGDFRRLGVSFEWHEFSPRDDVDWSRSFHPQSVELCLNLTGRGEVGSGADAARFAPGSGGFYRLGSTPLRAVRFGGEAHSFITVEFSPGFLGVHLADHQADLHPVVAGLLTNPEGRSGIGAVTPLNARQRELMASLRQPPVLKSAQGLWFQAKAIELVGEFFFQPSSSDELFCHRQQRVARDRVEAVLAI